MRTERKVPGPLPHWWCEEEVQRQYCKLENHFQKVMSVQTTIAKLKNVSIENVGWRVGGNLEHWWKEVDTSDGIIIETLYTKTLL